MSASRPSVGFRSDRGPLLIGLMLASALVALNQSIVATAVPSVVADLGGFSEFPWLFSVYLVVQAVATPVCGRLSDLVGRKPVMLAGIVLFLVASVLCAVAWSMPALILFRALQGLGAGAVQPMGATIAGDVYSLAERARVQGYLASVWGISAVLGPLLGGILAEYASWRWAFWINVPLGLIALVLLKRTFTEQSERRRGSFDYLGALLLSAGCGLLLLGLLEGGQAWRWASVESGAAFGGAVVLLAGFVLVERRATAPILPLWVFTRRLLLAASLVGMGVGGILFGYTSYIPTFAQGVLGVDAITAGLVLATLTIGWPVTSGLAGRLYLRVGFRFTALLGSVFVVSGTGLVTVAADVHNLPFLAGALFVVGVGMGLIASPSLIAAQSSVGWAERGAVTGTNLFSRSLGSALGVAAFGAVANGVLAGAPATGQSLANASMAVFLGVAGVAVAMVGAISLMPGRGVRLGPPQHPDSDGDEAAGRPVAAPEGDTSRTCRPARVADRTT